MGVSSPGFAFSQLLPCPNLLAAGDGEGKEGGVMKKETSVLCKHSQDFCVDNISVLLALLATNPKHNSPYGARKRINSILARLSTPIYNVILRTTVA